MRKRGVRRCSVGRLQSWRSVLGLVLRCSVKGHVYVRNYGNEQKNIVWKKQYVWLLLTSWTRNWTERSNPQSPILLNATPTIRDTATSLEWGSKKTNPAAAAAKQPNCQLRNHSPDRMGPILFMMNGAAQVPDSSAITEPIRMQLTCTGLKPVCRRYVVMVVPKERTVR